jgi:hypothetical protein
MAAQAWPAQATTIAIDKLNTAVTYVVLGEVISITGVGGGETGEADTTHLSSTVKTNRATIRDPKDVVFELNFDPTDTDHKYVRDLQDTAVTHGWKVTFPTTTPTTAVFQAWVKSVEGVDAAGVEENLKATITLRVTGATTWGP